MPGCSTSALLPASREEAGRVIEDWWPSADALDAYVRGWRAHISAEDFSAQLDAFTRAARSSGAEADERVAKRPRL